MVIFKLSGITVVINLPPFHCEEVEKCLSVLVNYGHQENIHY